MKKTPAKVTKRKKKAEVDTEPEMDFAQTYEASEPVVPIKQERRFPSFTFSAIFVLVGLLIGLLVAYQGIPVIAIVNGQPIFRWEVANVLFQRYGQQTVEALITEKLIADEAKKEGVTVTQADIEQKEKEILANFGSNLSIEDFLKFQGLQRKDFDNQIKLQLIVQNLLGKDLNITDDDITNYIASNAAMLTATEPATLREEAKQAIQDEQISTNIQGWLQELKEKASIQRFVNP